jgi:hypothetical protein
MGGFTVRPEFKSQLDKFEAPLLLNYIESVGFMHA